MTDNAHQRAFFTVEQLAGRWQVSSRTVRRMLERYELRAIYVGKQLRIASDEVTRFEQRNSLTAALRQSSHTPPSRGGRLLGDNSGSLDVFARSVAIRCYCLKPLPVCRAQQHAYCLCHAHKIAWPPPVVKSIECVRALAQRFDELADQREERD